MRNREEPFLRDSLLRTNPRQEFDDVDLRDLVHGNINKASEINE